MKKLTLVLGLVALAFGSVLAQNSNVNKAEAARNEGNLAEAKELIDPATEHEKTMAKGRTWYIRGQIYSDIASSEDASVRALDPDAVPKAKESFAKVMELEKPGSNYATLTEIQEQNLYNAVYNLGVGHYSAEEFGDAYDTFKKVIIIAPDDTIGYMFAAYSAQAAEDYDKALDMYYQLIDMDYTPKDVFSQAIVLNENIKQDYDKALEVCQKAMEAYPDEQLFDKSAIAMYIKLDRMDEALTALETALESEPENANLWYNLAYLHSEAGNTDKSIEAYKKSIEADPEYINAYINLAYDYTQMANDILKEKEQYNTLDLITKNQDKIEDIDKRADDVYNEALPLLEKANEINPDDQAILESLNGIYVRLKMTDKADAVTKQLVALGYWEEN